jgi:hypothetical protein
MKDTTTPPEVRTISFVDGQGRTITMPAPPPKQVTEERRQPAAKTVEDTNLTRKVVGKDGTERKVAVTLRDDSVQEIFERVPALLTRFGSGLVLVVLLLVLTAMAFIKYPETIRTTAMLREVPVVAGNDIPRLQSMFDGTRRTSEALVVPLPNEALRLGPLQLPYQEFLLAYEAYREDGDRRLLVETLLQLDRLEIVFASWKSTQAPAVFAPGAYFADLEVPVAATAGLKLGQHVSVELAKYPTGRYGRLSGTVAHIQPPATADGLYQVSVSLPDGLVTTNMVNIPFEEGLAAGATIVTERKSLLKKILW